MMGHGPRGQRVYVTTWVMEADLVHDGGVHSLASRQPLGGPDCQTPEPAPELGPLPPWGVKAAKGLVLSFNFRFASNHFTRKLLLQTPRGRRSAPPPQVPHQPARTAGSGAGPLQASSAPLPTSKTLLVSLKISSWPLLPSACMAGRPTTWRKRGETATMCAKE